MKSRSGLWHKFMFYIFKKSIWKVLVQRKELIVLQKLREQISNMYN